MKKNTVSLGALAIAMILGSQSIAPQTPVLNAQTQSHEQDKQKPVCEPVISRRHISINPSGGLDFAPLNNGMSPKEFGQYLQHKGLQKWSKCIA